MIAAPKLLSFMHGQRRRRRFNDGRRAACVRERIVEAKAVRNASQQLDRVARRGALVEHHADDQHADEARLPGCLVDLMQADAESVFVHAIDAAGEPLRKADAGVDAFRLNGDQHLVIASSVVIVVAAVQTRGHHRRAAARRIAQSSIRVLRDRTLKGDFQAIGKAVQFLPDVGGIGFQRGFGVLETESEGTPLLAAREGPAAQCLEKTFGGLFAHVIGTSPAFQDIDTPRLDHRLPLRHTATLLSDGLAVNQDAGMARQQRTVFTVRKTGDRLSGNCNLVCGRALAMRKVWIEVALNGAWSRRLQPGIPDTVEQIVTEGIACARAGAAMVHTHAYADGGRQTFDWQVYARIIEGIRNEVDVPVYPSYPALMATDTEASLADAAARFGHIEALAARGLLEFALVDPGSINMTLLAPTTRAEPIGTYLNPESHIR